MLQEDLVSDEELREWRENRVTRYIYDTMYNECRYRWLYCNDLHALGKAQGAATVLDMIDRPVFYFTNNKKLY